MTKLTCRIGFLLFILFSFVHNSYADHILGGQISYSQVAGNEFLIKLELFRACNSSGATFDNPATLRNYKLSTNGDIWGSLFQMTNPTIQIIDPQQDDCSYSPYPFCIEKATYYSEDNSILSSVDSIFYIAYQRCCRSPVYSNIVNSDEVGNTAWIQLNVKGFQDIWESNSTPNLNTNLFFEVCPGEEFEFDISAEDNEGDVLVYELWSPYSGAGPYGTPEEPGDPNACDGIQPTGQCPPPFDEVIFVAPNYSANLPLGSSAALSIDESTGIISGIPQILGQFLVGVRVKEYRFGELISISHQEVTIRVDIGADINNLQNNSLSISPNPFENDFTLELPDPSESYKLYIRDINGKIIKHLEINHQDKTNIYLNGLKGIYFLELKSDTAVYVDKIIAL